MENAELDITKFVLEFARYADNIVFSLESVEEYFKVKQDLVKTFKQFSMNLKYVVSDIFTKMCCMINPEDQIQWRNC